MPRAIVEQLQKRQHPADKRKHRQLFFQSEGSHPKTLRPLLPEDNNQGQLQTGGRCRCDSVFPQVQTALEGERLLTIQLLASHPIATVGARLQIY